MKRISFRRFLETGRFGDLYLGMSRQLVKDSFGLPEMTDGGAPFAEAAAWIYGEFTVCFGEVGIATSFGLYYILDYGTSEAWSWEGWHPKRGMPMAEVVKYLDEQKLPYRTIEGWGPAFLLGSGVCILRRREISSVLFGVEL